LEYEGRQRKSERDGEVKREEIEGLKYRGREEEKERRERERD
jgi:hypothetical protein